MAELFNVDSILLHMLNALILFAACYFLLYKPVRKFLKARQDKIDAQLKTGQEAAEGRDALVEQGKQALARAQEDAQAQAVAITAQARARGQAAIDEANEQAKKIIADAQAQAEQLRASTREAMVQEAAELAFEMAQTILARELSDADQKRLVDEFLKKVE